MKFPVFSNYALSGLDSKVSAEMRSTGEGIAIADNLNEALKKAFHVTLKNKTGNVILVSSNDGLEDYHEVAAQSGSKLVLAARKCRTAFKGFKYNCLLQSRWTER